MEQARLWIKERAVFKGTFTRIHRFLEDERNAQDLSKVQIKYEQLVQTWNNYEDVQTKLEIHDETVNHEQDRIEIEDKVHELKARLKELLDRRHEIVQPCSADGSREFRNKVKLPAIRLPQFEGQYEKWLSFSDTFKALVHNNTDVTTIQKYHYLLSTVSGQALQLISNLPITEDNYIIAWKLLGDRYSNKRLIASTHLREIFNIKPIYKESASEIIQFVNTATSNINALKALEIETPLQDILLTYFFTQRLDNNSRKEWELTLRDQSFPTLNNLFMFLEHKRQALENIISVDNSNIKYKETIEPKTKPGKIYQQRYSYIVADTTHCCYCNELHPLHKCSKFASLNVAGKQQFVRKHELCFNCLRTGHISVACKSGGCKKCNRRHHTLLHNEYQDTSAACTQERDSEQHHSNNTGYDESPTRNIENNKEAENTYCALKSRMQSQVLLSTAIILIADSNGYLQPCRALLDSGSQAHFCTENLVQRLKLKKNKHAIPIRGINNTASDAKFSVEIQLQSTVNVFKANLLCSVLPHITADMPQSVIDYKHWNLPNNIKLADPNFFSPGGIDLLIGAELFLQILKCEKKTRQGDFPVLQNTEFGWILAGRFQQLNNNSFIPKQTCLVHSDEDLNHTLQRFWELEDIQSVPRTKDEKECEQHFTATTTRNHAGRFVVRLPFRPGHKQLGDSFNHASHRLQQLEKRLYKKPKLQDDYTRFLEEYETLGHMTLISTNMVDNTVGGYYLPHHPVLKGSSSTTKTRVVFDASAKTTNGKSLNDILLVGPTIQQDLCSIILRFRTHQIVFTADITKMYRQISVHPEDTKHQRILWRSTPEDSVKCFELNTVTYGTSSAPFLATRCLQQLAEEEGDMFPRAAEILKRDFYVDDVLSGCNEITEALQLQSELIALLNKGGFPLHKWCSNHSALLEAVKPELRETKLPLQLDNYDSVKTLGLLWHPNSDTFNVRNGVPLVHPNSPIKYVSKRKVSSIIASIFDPLGLISPIVISYKTFLQRLWLCKIDWDDNLPNDLQLQWHQLYQQLSIINDLQIDRMVTCKGIPTEIHIHGFSDASESSYGCCLYLRSTNNHGEISVNLLCSKSRVAPVKKVTLPRLELCGAVLLAQLLQKILPILNLTISEVHLWTDSTIVLSWLASSATRWKTFVANRVAQIQEYTKVRDWKHVPSEHNPADIISRGTDPTTLRQLSLWWHGPDWLKRPVSDWPSSAVPVTQDISEQRTDRVALLATDLINDEVILSYSTYTRLTRIVAYCRRFLYNTTHPKNKRSGTLSAEELQHALQTCIKIIQRIAYQNEIKDLQSKSEVSKKSKLLNLHPFLDDQNILRVGGRLNHSELIYDAKHPMILPTDHHLTKLIIKEEHVRLLHAGPQLLIASLRQLYWIPRIKQVTKNIIHNCLPCFKLKASSAKQLMGQLPKERVQPTRPFVNTGVDYAGPFTMKPNLVRSKTMLKCYAAIFVCLATKAVHIELVSDLSSEAFIAALKRFTSRRGKCLNMFSDNGTNFIGANHELQNLRELFLAQSFNKRLEEYAAKEQFKWHFIPPSSPHFGGLWEAAVKSMKYHLKRVAGTANLTFEEMTTLLAQIEACMNSRPITVLSSDPCNPSFLSPGHFLIGAPLVKFPEPELLNLPLNRLSRWQRIQQMQQQLWKLWSSDYLTLLQQRTKWKSTSTNLQPGTVVLIRDDHLPPLQWKLAVIHEIFPGDDGLVRVASVRTGSSVFKRPIHKLVVLPSDSDI